MNYIIVLASGSGKRMGTSTPKQFIDVLGKPLICYSLQTFNANENIDEIIIVTKKKYFAKIYDLIDKYNLDKVHMLVEGGKYRQESTYNALMALHGFANKDDIILIHDSARPLVKNDDVNRLIECAKKHKAATLGSKVFDTTAKVTKRNKFVDIVPRDELMSIQTPQAFTYSVIYRAHKKAIQNSIKNASDDAQLVKLINKNFYLVEGSKTNFKVTTIQDLDLLEALIRK